MSVKKCLMVVIASIALLLILSGCSSTGASGTPNPNSPAPAAPPVSSKPRGNTGTLTTGQVVVSSPIPVTPAGGRFTLNKPGEALNGLELAVPPDSYPENLNFAVSYSPIQKHSFGANLNPISPLITVDNGGAYAEGFMTVKVPVKVPAGHFAMGFIYDQTDGHLEGLPLVARDADSITIATQHFSSFFISSVDESLLEEDFDSGFRPGVDDWQFTNWGSYIVPTGQCAGQSITALWYYVTQPDGPGVHLYGTYDNNGRKPATPDFLWDDSWGYRFASTIQSDLDWDSVASKMSTQLWGQNDADTRKLLAYSIMETGQPQQLGIFSITGSAHALICYRVNNDQLYIADPNYPGKTDRKIQFRNGEFQPYNSGANAEEIAKGNQVAYQGIRFFQSTSFVSWSKIRERWAQVKDKTIGNDKFPEYKIAWVDESGKSHDLLDGYVSPTRSITFIVVSKTPLSMFVYSNGQQLPPGVKELKPGNNLFGFFVAGKVNDSNRFVDYRYLNVVYNGPATTPTAQGKAVYKLQPNPLVTAVTKPSAAGISSALAAGSASYSNPDPAVVKATQSVAWTPPAQIALDAASTVSYQSTMAVSKADPLTTHIPKTGVESWQQARDVTSYPGLQANPYFRLVTTFQSGDTSLRIADLFQISPDDGKTWQEPLTADAAWQRYREQGVAKQVVVPFGVWATMVKKYSPPDASKPLPLTTPPEPSTLQFRFNPEFSGPWPDKIMISVKVEATGLTGSSGSASLGSVVYTYQKQ